ncbi:hypothetical protein E2C01_025751 [Portunus trituberculatus]|uniref:Secreted protein n=1 Tax=Portunus trituberculatus TaxID=210409 RepID=A0A5B7EDS1_PORTR|nr:hypothetical protein [Portunus trituberculatus]
MSSKCQYVSLVFVLAVMVLAGACPTCSSHLHRCQTNRLSQPDKQSHKEGEGKLLVLISLPLPHSPRVIESWNISRIKLKGTEEAARSTNEIKFKSNSARVLSTAATSPNLPRELFRQYHG